MVDAPGLQVWLVGQGLGEYCYIKHIAQNYNGSDRPTGRNSFRRWLNQFPFLEEFEDDEGNECVRLKTGGASSC